MLSIASCTRVARNAAVLAVFFSIPTFGQSASKPELQGRAMQEEPAAESTAQS